MKLSVCAIVTTATFYYLYHVVPVYAANECNPNTGVTVMTSTSTNVRDVLRAMSQFEDLFVGSDNGIGDKDTVFGFRTISWEEIGIPANVPDDTFEKTILKGLEFVRKPNQSYLVNENLFADLNAEASKDFDTFSGKHLMASRGSDTISLIFHEVDGGDGPIAGTRGFGVVFVDVDLPKKSKLVVKDKNGCVIAEAFAEPQDKGFSFVGIYVDDFSIFSVDIVTPTDIDGKSFGRRRRFGAKPPVDFVAFDNFVYGEPHSSSP